jgi:hypothetical protein
MTERRSPTNAGDRKTFQQRAQRESLSQLVSGTPQQAAPELGRAGHAGPQQRGLADSWLAFHQYRDAASGGDVLHTRT